MRMQRLQLLFFFAELTSPRSVRQEGSQDPSSGSTAAQVRLTEESSMNRIVKTLGFLAVIVLAACLAALALLGAAVTLGLLGLTVVALVFIALMATYDHLWVITSPKNVVIDADFEEIEVG